jgi:hypothetical protein
MIYSYKIREAIKFAVQTHEIDQKQKRKGKDIPYITHPLTIGLILSQAGASDEIIAAGILHDTIEDSIPKKKVTQEILIERFGEEVATLVESVTEKNKNLSWEERKREALERIKDFSHGSLLVKSADVINNLSELIDDYKEDGDKTFDRFNASKEKILQHHLELIRTIVECWPENPLASEMTYLARQLQMIGALSFMKNHPAKLIEYRQYDEHEIRECPICHWRGTAAGHIEYHDDLLYISCPICSKMILIVNYPLVKIGV